MMKKFFLIFIISLAISVVSIFIYNEYKIVDLFIAFLLGAIIGQFIKDNDTYEKFHNYFLYLLIPIGLFFYGSQINLIFLIKQKPITYLLLFTTIILYFLLIIPLNRYIFGINNKRLNYILASANAICGITATIILIPFTNAKREEIHSIIISVFITGLISSIIFICLSHIYFNLNPGANTILAATTINNTGSLLFVIDNVNRNLIDYAMSIKGVRVSTIIPVSIILMCLFYNKNNDMATKLYEHFNNSILYIITLAFLLISSSILFTFFHGIHKEVTVIYKIIFCMVLANIGMSCKWTTNLGKIILNNFFTSFIAWLAVTLVGYCLLKIFYF